MQINRKKLLKRTLIISAGLAVSALLFTALLFLLVFSGISGPLPDREELLEVRNEEASLVYSADSIIIGKYFAMNRTNIRYHEVPAHLINALIATEDKRFFTHKGYDTRSYFRVLFRSILLMDRGSGGGSTITQQLVKNLYGRNDYGPLSMPVNKIKELFIAARMEEVYTKDEVLLLYLNSVPFGENIYGVESASQRYFNKPARELHVEESAVLIGMLKANTHFNPHLNPENSVKRRNLVIALMENGGYLDQEMADSLQNLPMELDYENMALDAPAGYFVYQVKKETVKLLDSINVSRKSEYNLEKDGLKIYTTLDMKIQRQSIEAVKNHLPGMQKLLDQQLEKHMFRERWYKKQEQGSENFERDTVKREMILFDLDSIQKKNINRFDSLWHYVKMLNASVLITNPKNGEVITWIGGNHYRYLPFDMVLSHRQSASAFKPFLYATALESGISPCTYLDNKERIYPEYQDWEPKNADHKSTPDSTVAFWYAMTHSMNLPTVDLYFKLKRDSIVQMCNKLHFPPFADSTPSIALGTLDLSLYEIVKGYSSFANGGSMNELVMINKITDADGNVLYNREPREAEDIFSMETSQILTAILQQVVEQGTGQQIRTGYKIESELAGKTGTSQNYSDAWFIAYTPDLVVGTWVGAGTPDVHFYSDAGSGSVLALPIVAQVIKGIEMDPGLSEKYLTAFDNPEYIYAGMQCEPFRQEGIKGIFNRLFGGDRDRDNFADDSIRQEETGEEKRSFLNKLFRRDK
ncbi:MAG: transglycosylase domain-containing protein [Bacteroidales bacterium]